MGPTCICSYVRKPLQFFKEIGIAGPEPTPVMGNLGLFRKFQVCSFSLYSSACLMLKCVLVHLYLCTCAWVHIDVCNMHAHTSVHANIMTCEQYRLHI